MLPGRVSTKKNFGAKSLLIRILPASDLLSGFCGRISYQFPATSTKQEFYQFDMKEKNNRYLFRVNRRRTNKRA